MSDCVPGVISKLLYAGRARCMAKVNPRRPTWRCKATPVWLWLADKREPDGRQQGWFVCDDHRHYFSDCEPAA